MSRPALIEKLLQAGKWLLKPDLIPVDGTTLKRGAADISVAAEALARSGGGLAVDAKTGKLYVDFSLVPDDQMQAIVLAMVQQGGGLAVDRAGKLYVDFGSMPTDKFDAMLKSIRVPVWLSRNLTVYVATTGSDTLDEGRGLTEDKPFRTIQAALRYASTTYNLYVYNLTISIAAGDYGRADINLPAYTTSTGMIAIRGATGQSADVRCGRIVSNYANKYSVYNLTVHPRDFGSGAVGGLEASAGVIHPYNVTIDLRSIVHPIGSLWGVYVYGSGEVRPWATSTEANGIVFDVSGAEGVTGLINCDGGAFNFAADLTVNGSFTVTQRSVTAVRGGVINRGSSILANPGRPPVIIANGAVTGIRYQSTLNGIISVGGGGPDFWPGSMAGTTATGGQYA